MAGFRTVPVRLLVVAAGCCLVIVIVAVSVAAVWRLWQPRPLSAFLPAGTTVAFATHAAAPDVKALEPLFPVLSGLPHPGVPSDIGIVRLSDGKQAWVLAPSNATDVLPSANIRVGRERFLASDPRVEQLLASGTAPLRSDLSYRRLLGANDGSSILTVAFLDADPARDLPKTLRDMLSVTVGRVGGPFLLSRRPGGEIVLRMTGTGAVRAAPSSTVELSPAPMMTLSWSDGGRMLEGLSATLDPARAQIAEAVVRGAVEQALGEGTSFRYDILPLLKRPGSIDLTWARTATGTQVRFLLRARDADRSDLIDRVALIHGEFSKALLGATVVRRSLDYNLHSAVLTGDPGAVEDGRDVRNGWTVRTTADKISGAELLSARKGSELLVSNTSAWLLRTVDASADDLLFPREPGTFAGGGTADLTALDTLLQNETLGPWTLVRAELHAAKRVQWGLSADGWTVSLSLR